MKLNDTERKIIERHRAEEAEKKANAWGHKKLEDYTPTAKIAGFERLYKMALEELEARKANDGYGGKDFEHYAYEAVMDLLGPDIWTTLNNLGR